MSEYADLLKLLKRRGSHRSFNAITTLEARNAELTAELQLARFGNAVTHGTSHPEMYKTELDECKELVAALRSEQQWISVDEQLPDIPIGDEMHCFLLLELHHQSNEGKSIVVDGYWANKPADPAWGEDVEAPDWALETEDGDYLNLVGWAELTHHPDYSGYYTSFETTYRNIVAWMPIKYPLAPK